MVCELKGQNDRPHPFCVSLVSLKAAYAQMRRWLPPQGSALFSNISRATLSAGRNTVAH